MKERPYQDRIELLQGTLDLLILRTLRGGAQHGHGIVKHIHLTTDEVLKVDSGSLYPALHRLERQGWIASEWRASENNRRAKYYRLTTAGRRQLGAEQSRWEQLTRAIARVLNPEGA